MNERRRWMYAALALALAAAVWIRVGPGDDEVAPPPPRSATAQRAAAGEADAIVDLRLADLDVPAAQYEIGRSPFQFGGPSPEELAELERQRQERLAAQREAERLAQIERDRTEKERLAQLERDRLNPPPPPEPVPPPFQMTYLGSFGTASRKIAVFTDGKEIYNVREGDVIEGKFIIAKIGYESVDVKFVGFPDHRYTRVPIASKGG